MLPLPLILAIVLAAAVLVIVFLLFQQFGRGEEDLGKHTLQLKSLRDKLADRDTQVKQLSNQKDKLGRQMELSKQEIENAKKEVVTKDAAYRELKGKYDRLQKQAGTGQNLSVQLQQKSKQVTEQLIKYKKLEKDLHAAQDELARLKQAKPEAPKPTPEAPKPTPEAPKPEPPKPRPELPKPEAPKPKESPFKRFLKPNIGREEKPKPTDEGHKPEAPK